MEGFWGGMKRSRRLRCSWKAGTTISLRQLRMPDQLKEPSFALHLHKALPLSILGAHIGVCNPHTLNTHTT